MANPVTVNISIAPWAVAWAREYCERFYEPDMALVKLILMAAVTVK